MPIEALVNALGADKVVSDDNGISNYAFDWTGNWYAKPVAVVLPENTEDVSAALKICHEMNFPVVTQGGNSGLVGGAVGGDFPHVVLSTKNLRSQPIFNSATNQLTLGAGFTLQEVQEIAQSHGMQYPVDTPSRALATIGGNVATNAGGVRVIAFGMTQQQVVGLRVVLSDGSVIDRLERLKKENTGFDITALFSASEGTLGVITDVCLQLRAPRTVKWTAAVPCTNIQNALDVALSLQNELLAAELFQTSGANKVAEAEGMKKLPAEKPWWLILEGDGDKPELPTDSQWALTPSEAAKLWNYRELQASMLNRLSKVVKVDSSVAPTHLPAYIERITQELSAGDDLYIFGHLLDGNLHISVANAEEKVATDIVLDAAVGFGGSVSAEHGIGQAKNDYVHLTKSVVEMKLMNDIRDSFDPKRILNPHVLKFNEDK
jgi:FAD/FMN-containing dehydrogenase